ncbi:RNA polymerase insert [Desulfurococcaceae archaeon AG1]|nr:MAG: DNA-directed RNA polymerase subunit D [Desulfurococcaceae archaeon]GAY24860.1 RNA polymerase insert [Desulfurococcaceae archaeon AG1]
MPAQGFGKIEVEVLRRDEISVELVVRGIPLPVLNAVRRIMQLEVPTAAVEDVIFYENNTPIYDEIIAHRLAMLPILSEDALRKLRSPDECYRCFQEPSGMTPEEMSKECGGCFTIMRFQGEAGSEPIVVRAGDLKTDDPDIRPSYPEIPITVIGPGQRIAFDARIRLGRGIEHIKWSPVTVAGTRYVANITTKRVSEDMFSEVEKCVEVCPVKILSFNKEEGRIEVSDIYKCTLCMQCVKKCPPESIDVKPRSDEYILFYESAGQLSVKTIALQAIDILISKIDHLIDQVKSLKGG